jgi:hypothetical protein
VTPIDRRSDFVRAVVTMFALRDRLTADGATLRTLLQTVQKPTEN